MQLNILRWIIMIIVLGLYFTCKRIVPSIPRRKILFVLFYATLVFLETVSTIFFVNYISVCFLVKFYEFCEILETPRKQISHYIFRWSSMHLSTSSPLG